MTGMWAIVIVGGMFIVAGVGLIVYFNKHP
jgi:hypothetical protein